MPPAQSLMPRLVEIKQQLLAQGTDLILMIDHPAQVEGLAKYSVQTPWLVYLKLDIGSKYVIIRPLPDTCAALTNDGWLNCNLLF